ncbi:INO80 complex subunit B [Drosophila busckii]|uniref:INO80 complex subunit B n=1 Tax=Drosophila busckii TaxID=30019 RepID=UPI00083F45DC|nr:INO80 complex subunit B [Drosophila busckii]
MEKSEDRRSKRNKRQKPARFVSPTECVIEEFQTNSITIEQNMTESTSQRALKETLAHSLHTNKALERVSSIQHYLVDEARLTSQLLGSTSVSPNNTSKKSRKRRNSDTSSDEERWLNAIETGKLDDVDDELKKMKDPKLMTARQRAMYERTQESELPLTGFVEQLIALPNGYREKEKPQTAEEIQKAALKSQKRKQQADERREKDKQKTMERLLKKQDSNKQRLAARNKFNQKQIHPTLTYINTLDGAYINVPFGHEFPIQSQFGATPPAIQLCGVTGCVNRKVYSCSKTNVFLCSLACYQKNLGIV